MIEAGFSPVAVVRRVPDSWHGKCPVVEVGDIGPDTDWTSALIGIESIIHTAARVHITNESSLESLTEYRKVNVDGTLSLARQAAKAGVKKFIFLSSIKVHGEFTKDGRPFTEEDPPHPEDSYGISKFEAEQGLRNIAEISDMKIIIIRPVLVYGPGVKGNFLALMRLIKLGIPLPFGAIKNARSFIALDNLIDFILLCLDHPAAENNTFIVSDGEDISTLELIKILSQAIEVKSRAFSIPINIILFIARLLGRADIARRLCCNLQVDISKAENLLGWNPSINIRNGLARAFSQGSP